MIQWEYKTVVVQEDRIDDTLLRHGQIGYELVQVLQINATCITPLYRLFFKKRHGDA
jgi:hypothetical protein